MLNSLILLAVLHAWLCKAQITHSIHLDNGTLQGLQCPNSKAYGYLSIPYAEPPIGDLRLAAPSPFKGSYNGSYTNTAPSCFQFGTNFLESGNVSEDCLYLDIWTPFDGTNASDLPVKVWIYGGGNTAGGTSDPAYDGCNSAADAVHVSVGYRLGPLGGLALPSAGIGGNYHIQDILLGLQWVQTNIAAFGGDKDKVLLFGQSAGADNSFVIATLPQAPSLIKATILESGGGEDDQTVEGQQSYMEAFVAALNCSSSDGSCIRSKSAQDMNQALTKLPNDPKVDGSSTLIGPNKNRWHALVDCDIVPAQPADVGVKVPTIYGSTTQESTLFVFPLAPGFDPKKYSQAIYDEYLVRNFGPFASEVNATYPASAYNESGEGIYNVMVQVDTDSGYKCPAFRGLQAAAKNGVAVWTYSWGQAPTCDWYNLIPNAPLFLKAFGACHTSEVPYVFGNTEMLAAPNGTCSLSKAEKNLSSTIVRSWNNMAANANPGFWWPQFTFNNTLGINVENATVTAGVVDYSSCEFWGRINAQIRQNVTAVAYEPTCSGKGSNSTVGNGNSTSTTGAPKPHITTSLASRRIKPDVLPVYQLLFGLGVALLFL
ncbi:alpha/beta-hydrolase [Myriangium duriaei CBS 260.36]|uniref:Carboxylic ester hydrolase n=1 Tax=Myriangium duriaei CBS 260.36 TaxID=1168546 RepID=A0A9P4J192_9PEZI|nr:alpha/beta-hydrolase [Myriangium duriaei CBS 260.36]